eukprot:TRINITY_DN15838_c0_g1_i1.p1 TRINITY_DN15838_c0_g1~~TRINITY_DN15838_c0_g1_i1.p1  ORF type:complete len:255 (-),score=52.78 TRINITY_DN15838_c0_g1_i1:308-1030(-)
MALFLQSARRKFLSFSSRKITSVAQLLSQSHHHPHPKTAFQTRSYISEMRKSAFEGNILRILRTEIQYQSEYAPPKELAMEFESFTVEDKPGEQWIRLRGKYGEKEDIKIEVTMFDGAVQAPKAGDSDKEDDMKLHISLIVDVSKGEKCDNVLEFICSAWPDSLEIQKVFMLKRDRMAVKPFVGPNFKDLDDEFQEALYEFLEARGVNDDLAVFLHDYMMNKDRIELIRWLGNVKSFVEN